MTAHTYGYVRVSTQDQDHQAQVRDLLAAGVPDEHIHTEKLSGILRAADRPALEMTLGKLRKGDTLYVVALDRLGRDLRDTINLVYDLTDKGVRVRSLKEGLDTDNKITGPIIVGIFASLAEMERTRMLDRQAARRETMRLEGQPFGRPHAIPSETVRGAIVSAYKAGRPALELAQEFRISRATVFRYVRKYG